MTEPRKRGRPTLYTPERIKVIIDTIKIGGSEADACARAGIDQDTLAHWKSRNSDFAGTIEKARVEGKLARVGRIAKAGTEGHWQADAWYLERRFPEEFAQSFIIKVSPEQMTVLKKYGLSAGEAFAEMIKALSDANASA